LNNADKSPLEFVGVYNSEDHCITNKDGRFYFFRPKILLLFTN